MLNFVMSGIRFGSAPWSGPKLEDSCGSDLKWALVGVYFWVASELYLHNFFIIRLGGYNQLLTILLCLDQYSILCFSG
jgi:hypothetical protein